MRTRLLAVGALALAVGCAPTTLRPSALPGDPVVVAAAGDISCPALSRVVAVRCQQAATAAAVADADFVVALGDLQYPGGTGTSWNGYDASWGALAAKTLPVIGNHEWLTPNAQGFYDYWASKGSPQTRGVWSRPLGNGWAFIGLDANCGKQDCKAELLALDAALFSAGQCAIVGWHQPRWSSGHHGSSPNKKLDALWSMAVAHGVPLVLNGHEHNYERTTPFGQTTEVVVGTGGKSMDAPTPPGTFTAKQIDSTFGHLRLTLTANNYTAEYRDLSGAVLDSFSGTC